MSVKTLFLILIGGGLVLSLVTFIVLFVICRKFAQIGASPKEQGEKDKPKE